MIPANAALGPVQTAVYERLTGFEPLMSLVTGVYDEVPEGTPKPYVVIGEAQETPDNRHGGFGRQTVATLHVWSRQRGFSEATAIANEVIRALDHQPLSIADTRHIVTRFEFSQTLRDTDPELRHVPLRFRIVTEQ